GRVFGCGRLCRRGLLLGGRLRACARWHLRRPSRAAGSWRLLSLLLLLALLLHLRQTEEDLPSDQDQRRQHDEEERILLIIHLIGSYRLRRSSCDRGSVPPTP